MDLLTPEALGALLAPMLAFARLQLRDATLAEDAVQEALAAALAGGASFSGQSSLKTWVFAILRHKIVDLLRQQQRTVAASDLVAEAETLDAALDTLFAANAHWQPAQRPQAWAAPDQALEDKQFWDAFDACLLHLPENTARVFMMREFLDLETEEICRTLALSSNNCHVILHRARSALRRCLEQSWFCAGEKPC